MLLWKNLGDPNEGKKTVVERLKPLPSKAVVHAAQRLKVGDVAWNENEEILFCVFSSFHSQNKKFHSREPRGQRKTKMPHRQATVLDSKSRRHQEQQERSRNTCPEKRGSYKIYSSVFSAELALCDFTSGRLISVVGAMRKD
jgi:hypothetical protein